MHSDSRHSRLNNIVVSQVEELKTIPNEPTLSAPALAAKVLDQVLNVQGSAAAGPNTPLPVNDLTSVVKKKKKPVAEADATQASGEANGASSAKRKADDDGLDSQIDKKVKVEETSVIETAASAS